MAKLRRWVPTRGLFDLTVRFIPPQSTTLVHEDVHPPDRTGGELVVCIGFYAGPAWVFTEGAISIASAESPRVFDQKCKPNQNATLPSIRQRLEARGARGLKTDPRAAPVSHAG
jgi:hypothetical protein